MAILDTSLLVPLFDRGHPHHDEAKQVAVDHRIWHVPSGVIAETTQVLCRLAKDRGLDGNRQARQALQVLESVESYRLVQGYDEELVSRVYATEPRLSYVDAWVVGTAYAQDEPLLTFDERQRNALSRIA